MGIEPGASGLLIPNDRLHGAGSQLVLLMRAEVNLRNVERDLTQLRNLQHGSGPWPADSPAAKAVNALVELQTFVTATLGAIRERVRIP